MRRYGLEKFLKRVAGHPKISQSQEFLFFMRDDEANLQIRMKESQAKKGWIGTFSDFKSSVSSTISSYMYGEQPVLQDEADVFFNTQRTELRGLYQQQELLCSQGNEMVANLDAEINSNIALSKAYENMRKVEKEQIAEKLKILAETHHQIAEVQKESFDKIKLLVGQDLEDYRRVTLGALETLERRNKIKIEKPEIYANINMRDLNADLKKDLEQFQQEKIFLGKSVSNQLIIYKQEMTEKISEVWREAYNRVIG
mmetsp:Transcript_10365/g.10337  ORF Transcript_10365/g.10337 Transcript_10365/m.10337 type:complete len:256 (-) Transcript_10365:1054-1821(-)